MDASFGLVFTGCSLIIQCAKRFVNGERENMVTFCFVLKKKFNG
jgi:hypothetical protein